MRHHEAFGVKASLALGASRQIQLAELLRQRGELRLRDIIAELGVARATAQRDLDRLAQQPWVSRTHGGVVVGVAGEETPQEYPAIRLEDRQTIDPSAKQRIALAAVDLLAGALTLYLDAGTTTEAFAQALVSAAWRPAWVVTNCWQVAEVLARAGIRHELLGGEVDAGSLAIAGATALNTLRAYRFDWAVLSADAITADGSVRVARPPEGYLKRAAAQASARRVLLAHAEKFGADSHFEVASLAEYDYWITDRADERMEKLCASAQVCLLKSEVG